ncbi:hypothetical protein SESBI_46261, partial [Sesbania bispinosa]
MGVVETAKGGEKSNVLHAEAQAQANGMTGIISLPYETCGRIPCITSSTTIRNHPKLLHFRTGYRLSIQKEEEVLLDEEDDPTAEMSYLDPEELNPESISAGNWTSAPDPFLMTEGEDWELVVCDNSLSLQYTKYFPNNVIKRYSEDAIVTICDDLGVHYLNAFATL